MKTKTKITTLGIITLLTVSLVISANSMAMSANVNSTVGSTINDTANRNQLKTYLDQGYIALLGLSSSIVAVNSSVQANVAPNGISYIYNATLTSKSGNYTVSNSRSNETLGNKINTTFNEGIIGKTNSSKTYNSSTSYVETTTITSKARTMDLTINHFETNSTGSYYTKLNAETNYTADQSKYLSGASEVDENVSGTSGIYRANAGPDSTGTIITSIVSPDGRLVTHPGLVVSPEVYVKPTSKLSVSPCDYYPFENYNTQGFNYAANTGFNPANKGSIYPWGFYEYWPTDWLGFSVGGLLASVGLVGGFAADLIASVLAGPLGVAGALIAISSYWHLEITGWLGTFTETCAYFDVLTYNFFGLQIPIWEELGFLGNKQFNFNTSQYESTPLTYHAIFDSIDLLMTESPQSHTDDWPQFNFIDPPVAIVAYDESNSQELTGIPVYINNICVQSGYTYYLPDGSYQLQFAGNNFDYVNVGGTQIYDNQPTVTFSGTDMITVTASYYSAPYAWLTVNYYDTSNNYVGGSSDYLPCGFYTVGENILIWDDYLGYYVVPEGQAFTVGLTSDTNFDILVGMA